MQRARYMTLEPSPRSAMSPSVSLPAPWQPETRPAKRCPETPLLHHPPGARSRPSPNKRRVDVCINSFGRPRSELHSRYGPLDRSAAQGGLCHEASDPGQFAQPSRSSSFRINGSSETSDICRNPFNLEFAPNPGSSSGTRLDRHIFLCVTDVVSKKNTQGLRRSRLSEISSVHDY